MEHDLERAIYPLEDLEIRQGRTISGSFPYGSTATRRSSGRVRKERIQPRAFRYAVDGEGRDRPLDLLVGHDFGKPLARRSTGSLEVTDTPSGLSFVATLPAPELQPTHVRDAVLMLESGLVGGISPGFQVPKGRGFERLEPEPGNPGVSIRVVEEAVLFELSLVTRPAYLDTTVELRAEDLARPEDLEIYLWL